MAAGGKLLTRAAAVVVVGVFLLAQLYQPERSNPASDPAAGFAAVVQSGERVDGIIERACRDCHSNQTVWPWYSRVSPMSWLIARDVREGRNKLNFSQWNIYGAEMSRLRMTEVCEQVKAGKMPPRKYLLLHPSVKLDTEDIAALCGSR